MALVLFRPIQQCQHTKFHEHNEKRNIYYFSVLNDKMPSQLLLNINLPIKLPENDNFRLKANVVGISLQTNERTNVVATPNRLIYVGQFFDALQNEFAPTSHTHSNVIVTVS